MKPYLLLLLGLLGCSGVSVRPTTSADRFQEEETVPTPKEVKEEPIPWTPPYVQPMEKPVRAGHEKDYLEPDCSFGMESNGNDWQGAEPRGDIATGTMSRNGQIFLVDLYFNSLEDAQKCSSKIFVWSKYTRKWKEIKGN